MSENSGVAKAKKSEKRQRQLTLRCRVLEAEANEIDRRAAQTGVSVPMFLRSAALGVPIRAQKKPVPTIDRQVLARLLGALGKTGSELNRIISLADFERLDLVEGLEQTLLEFRSVLARISKVLG